VLVHRFGRSHDQHFLVDEIFIDRLFGNAHFIGDVVHSDAFEPEFQEHFGRFGDDLLFHFMGLKTPQS
jgi:hypothetical protein